MDAIVRLLTSVAEWAASQSDVRAVALVGSHARGTAGSDSDVDLVVVVDDLVRRLHDQTWVAHFGDAVSVTHEDWGLVQSLRVTYADGREVEFGLTTAGWAEPPLEAGTVRVIRDGLRVVFDPDGLLRGASEAATPATESVVRRSAKVIHEARPAIADVLWALLVLAAGTAALLAIADAGEATAGLFSAGVSAWEKLVKLLFAVGGLAALVWVAAGSWRRTVWGCRVSRTGDEPCPRHGPRCVQAARHASRPVRNAADRGTTSIEEPQFPRGGGDQAGAGEVVGAAVVAGGAGEVGVSRPSVAVSARSGR